MVADIDERRRDKEPPDAYLERVTRDKLERVSAHASAKGAAALLVADTIVLLDEDILGKPGSSAEAEAMLGRLSGRTHEVRTRFALGSTDAWPSPRAVHAETVSTLVEFRPLGADEIRRYAATGEGADKAGAYAIQGIGSFAVRRIQGSYANVVGLPVCEVVLALQHRGLLGPFP
jgi:septum formation protein